MSTRPNVVFVLVDDMGYGDFGVFGDGSPHTPNLDYLVSEGLCLTQHYSGAPVCAPARACLLTGRYALRTGVVDTQDANGLDRVHPDEVTVGDYFSHHSYATGLIGKWHSGAYAPEYHPTARGFGEFVGFQGGWSDFYDYKLQAGRGSIRDGEYMTDVLTREAVTFIARHKSEPFFLHLNYNAPHFPFQAPREDVARFQHLESAGEDLRTLYAMLYRMDVGLGRVLEALREHGIEENTIVIFTSDNGPQMSPNVRRFNANWAGAKGTVYEGGIRVPAVIRWPGRVGAGRHSETMMHFNDWLPTLLRLAGLPSVGQTSAVVQPGGPLDGIDLAPSLLSDGASINSAVADGPAGEATAEPRFWQWNRYEPVENCNAAVRDGEWKLVYPQIDEALALSAHDISTDKYFKAHPDEANHVVPAQYERRVPPPHAPELYNLREDPEEAHNLADREPARLTRMKQMLETWFAEVEQERTSKEQGYAR